jgi:hypothetical protein
MTPLFIWPKPKNVIIDRKLARAKEEAFYQTYGEQPLVLRGLSALKRLLFTKRTSAASCDHVPSLAAMRPSLPRAGEMK